MKLKPIPNNTVVHTPTEAEAKELLAILHENGYKWKRGSDSLFNPIHYIAKEGFCIEDGRRLSTYLYISAAIEDKCTILTLAEFKERYCEEEKPQPKFRLGERIRIVSSGEEDFINMITEDDCYELLEHRGKYTESDLIPYTEPETKDEAKGLNLCELLKGHEGETFYSPIVGDCTLKAITNYIHVAVNDHPSYCFLLDGRREKSGDVVFFPSRALYEQYPLDPYTAWMKWQEEQEKYILLIQLHKINLDGTCGAYDVATKYSFLSSSDRDKCIEEIKAIINKYKR